MIHNDAYELITERALPDIHSKGLYFRHKKSGAKVAVLSNDDPNKVFYIGFRTPPTDSTGVPHIIEHTVLCGSEKFPVKDPFIELVKGSMNTFLNAMTYPDKTVYPVASTNDKDFKNLMDVYMDAVLHPNIYKEEKIFRQEGWHYELDSPEDELTINGVVYNEMKGAFSVADSVMERAILNSLYPDTPYHNESGGDPEVIPDLTYEDYLDFHRRFYHPSNSYIYLYGDMDVDERLAWLDAEYLSKYDAIDPASEISTQSSFDTPVYDEKYYSISSGDSDEDSAYLSLNWSVGSNLDAVQYVAFDILAYALLDTQGAPIKEALTAAGIGDDIYGGYDGGVFQPYFSVVAKNADEKDLDKFCSIIADVLREQADGGLNHTTLLAAINGAEFKFREADYGRIPKGLMLGLMMLDSWLYDDALPFLHLGELSIYAKLREKLDQGYFESLIKKYLIENNHSSIVTLLPKKGLNARREAALAARLKEYKDSLDEDGINAIVTATKDLAAYQMAPSAPEDLATIPMLSRDDMKKDSMPYSNISEKVGGVDFLWHDYETNGIIYLDFIFDIGHVPEEKVPYVEILRTLMGSLDTADYSYFDLANEVNLYTGGIDAETNVFADTKHECAAQAKYEIRIRTLDENLDKAIELAKSILLSTSLDDGKRMYDVLAENRSRRLTAIRESGNQTGATRAMSAVSTKSRYDDLLHGIGQYRFMDGLVDDFENKKDDLACCLKELAESLFTPGNLLVNVTCREAEYGRVKERVAKITEGLYPDMADRVPVKLTLPAKVNEAFKDASQIQYVCLGGNYKQAGLSYTGALLVLRCIMNYEYLWQNIRVLGGAYGCGCSVNRSGDICFTSYRDPNLSETLDVYRGVVEYLKGFDASDRDMTRFVIGAFSEMDMPLTPVALGRRSLVGYFGGISLGELQTARNQVLFATQDDIKALAAQVEAALKDAGCCVIGNEEKIAAEAGLFEHTEVL